jgi:hypothetical protein
MMNSEVVTTEAPYPKDFGVVVKQLDKFGWDTIVGKPSTLNLSFADVISLK